MMVMCTTYKCYIRKQFFGLFPQSFSMFEGVLRGRLFPIAYSVPLSEDGFNLHCIV